LSAFIILYSPLAWPDSVNIVPEEKKSEDASRVREVIYLLHSEPNR
jgi:hypothetical protein